MIRPEDLILNLEVFLWELGIDWVKLGLLHRSRMRSGR